jgi:SAM-dependent methyltransferase
MPDLWPEYEPSTYGDRIAEVYDAFYNEMPGSERAPDLLAELAGDGPALELGVGTGRVALPLAEKGIQVHGIDASAAMVDVLRSKPGGSSIAVTMGDMKDVDAPAGRYSLVFVVFNTFFALLEQEDQIACFGNVAKRLQPGGRFLLHCFVPDLERYDRRQSIHIRKNLIDYIRTDYSTIDPVKQLVNSHHVVIANGQVQTYPVGLRYCWPSELDLMAKLAGLELEHRWADWDKSPFTSNSNFHISVYRAGSS